MAPARSAPAGAAQFTSSSVPPRRGGTSGRPSTRWRLVPRSPPATLWLPLRGARAATAFPAPGVTRRRAEADPRRPGHSFEFSRVAETIERFLDLVFRCDPGDLSRDRVVDLVVG